MRRHLLRGLRKDQRGSMVIVVAFMMPVFIGGLGLGAEAGYWYFTQRKIQNAADVAAHAGAVQLRAGKSDDIIEAAALSAAVETGYKTAIGVFTTSTPPASGAFAGDTDAVEVSIQENVPRMLSALFAEGDVPLSGRAVAQVHEVASACLIALHPDAAGAVTFTGSSNAALEGCNVHANSVAEDAVTVIGSGTVETPCVSSVGGTSATSGLTMTSCNSPVEYAEPIGDPYATLPEPAIPPICEPVNEFAGPIGSTYTISGGRYCGGLIMKRTVTMEPGIYVVDGGNLEIQSSAVVDGAGVMVFLTNGAQVSIAASASVQLSAPTTGVYAGILIFSDPDNPYETHIINGDSTSFFTGAIYAPSGHVEIAGSGSVGGGCTQVVASTVEITGDAGLGIDCVGTGLDPIPAEQLVVLVE